jgi:serine phosphatase RsbU (regulator of sigma subunit)/CBS domain-containing protein
MASQATFRVREFVLPLLLALAMPQTALTIRQVMEFQPLLVQPNCPVQEVIRLMNNRRVGAVVITSEDRHLLGIFSERDLVRRLVSAQPGWREEPIGNWMTPDPYTISPDVGWEEAVAAMQRLRVRHLPVIENETVIGIISSRGLMSRRTDYLDQCIAESTQELRRANDQLLAREAELTHHLRAAGRLQTRLLLPKSPPNWPELGWAVHFAPLDHLGGDYYDLVNPTPNHLGILIADASGHSISAAMVAIMARFAFGEIAERTTRPGEVLAAMNRQLQDLADERFVTAFYGVLDRRTRVFRFANAGHPYPLWYHAGTGSVKPLMAQGFILGIIPDEIYSEREITLGEGDAICFYTDGLIEARNEIGEQFGDDRLTDCVRGHAMKTSSEFLANILQSQTEFCSGVPLSDDLTLAVFRLG